MSKRVKRRKLKTTRTQQMSKHQKRLKRLGMIRRSKATAALKIFNDEHWVPRPEVRFGGVLEFKVTDPPMMGVLSDD
jgi:hypothetical protein